MTPYQISKVMERLTEEDKQIEREYHRALTVLQMRRAVLQQGCPHPNAIFTPGWADMDGFHKCPHCGLIY
jgi:hypothetical protein